MSKRFPIFPSHQAAQCFNCGMLLAGNNPRDDYANGEGQFSQACLACGMRTWYDVGTRPVGARRGGEEA